MVAAAEPRKPLAPVTRTSFWSPFSGLKVIDPCRFVPRWPTIGRKRRIAKQDRGQMNASCPCRRPPIAAQTWVFWYRSGTGNASLETLELTERGDSKPGWQVG